MGGLLPTDFFISELLTWTLTQEDKGAPDFACVFPSHSPQALSSPAHTILCLAWALWKEDWAISWGLGEGGGWLERAKGNKSGWQDYGLTVMKGNCFC